MCQMISTARLKNVILMIKWVDAVLQILKFALVSMIEFVMLRTLPVVRLLNQKIRSVRKNAVLLLGKQRFALLPSYKRNLARSTFGTKPSCAALPSKVSIASYPKSPKLALKSLT